MKTAIQRKVTQLFNKKADAPRDSARPYRLWDVRLRRDVPHRYFSDPKRCHMAALCEARWMKVGCAMEVYDARTGRMLGQYYRNVDTIRFIEGGK